MSRGGKRAGAGRKIGAIPLPPVSREIKQELREVAREHAAKALETLVKVCESSRSDSAKVAAANALLDRGYGKPLQQHEVGKPHDFDRLSDEELDEKIAETLQQLGPIPTHGSGRSKH